MTPKNKIKNLKATLEATNQQITIIPTVIKIENQAVQDLYAQYRIRSIKNPKTREATLEAFVLKPCVSASITALQSKALGGGLRIENGEREGAYT
jgi:predicted RNase H-like nuclease